MVYYFDFNDNFGCEMKLSKALIRCLLIVLMSACLMAVFACTSDTGDDLYKTAEFEELQNNKEHAIQLYETILEKFPESEFAIKARERLADLEK